jgi:HEAT repeat protein
MILGLVGIADPAVIQALRKRVDGPDEGTRGWSQRALGYLGDVDWLLKQSADIAVSGCCANLSAFRDEGAQPYALDYTPVERLLALRPDYAAKVEELLAPGSSFCAIRATDVPEATRGLHSAHVAIRRHAASVLNERRVGKQGMADAVEALQASADDSDEQTRRLVGLALKGLVR